MTTFQKYFGLGALAAGLLCATGCNKLQARDQLNKGVQAYKSAQFNAAIEHFKRAIQLDPSLLNAKLYLATAYQSQYVPDNPSQDNQKLGDQAATAYKEILRQQPNNPNALQGLARLYLDMDQLDQSRDYYVRLKSAEPSNPIAYYSIGVIDWTQARKADLKTRTTLLIASESEPIVPAKKPSKKAIEACHQLAQQNGPIIQEGMDALDQAMKLRSNYADAMVYQNLLYRQKADIECENQDARTADLNAADKLASQALSARKAAAAAAAKNPKQAQNE